MRIVVSLTRKRSDGDALFDEVLAVGLSWLEDGAMIHFLAKLSDYDTAKDMWEAVSRVLGRTDVVPYGWNMHRDIWPCVCLNMVKFGIQFPKLQPLTEKWSKTMVGDIATIATQGSYRETPDVFDVYNFLFNDATKTCLVEERRCSNMENIVELSYEEHQCYHRMLEAYK